MSAKEIFKELGYKEDFHIAYIKYHNSEEDKYVWFNKASRTVEAEFDIDMKLLKAINKQIEELSWEE